MTLLSSGLTLTVTALVSLILTPLDFLIARQLGAIDIPKDGRRMHRRPVPRLGGISIFFAFLMLTLILGFDEAQSLFFAWAATILLTCVGVLDDSRALSPMLKLLAQFGAAYVSTMGGNVIRVLRFGEIELSAGGLSLPLTLIWSVTLINAHNFIDGLDGLCAGVVVAESAALGLMALRVGNSIVATVAFIVCGACVGFLPYNLNGAKLFMGDTGSTFLGFIMAWLAVALVSDSNAAATPSVYSLLLLFAVPLADIFVAVTRRLAKGKSPFLPDRSHIHHMLADTSLGHFGASRLMRLAAAFLAVMAYLIF